MDVTLYTFEDKDGEQGFSTYKYPEAEEYARRYQLRIIANVYEWTEAFTVADFSPDQQEEGDN